MRSAGVMAAVVGCGACLSGRVVGGSGTTPPLPAASCATAWWPMSARETARARVVRARDEVMSRMGSGDGGRVGRVGRTGQNGNMTAGPRAGQSTDSASDARQVPSDALDAGAGRVLAQGFEQLRLHERELLHPRVGRDVDEQGAVARDHAR